MENETEKILIDVQKEYANSNRKKANSMDALQRRKEFALHC